MIKRENLKQAIGEISKRDPEIGYSLDSLLAVGEIDVPEKDHTGEGKEDFFFLFKGQPVFIKKYLYFHHGIVPIEQLLLIKYGQMVRKQELEDNAHSIDYRSATAEIQLAGLRLMVEHEIDYAINRIRGELTRLKSSNDNDLDLPGVSKRDPVGQSTGRLSRAQFLIGLISFMEIVKKDDRPLLKCMEDNGTSYDSSFHAQGVIEYVTPARFMQFPFHLDALMQVAALDLEFFHIRFLLDCLIENTGNRLYACVVEGKIKGLIFLELKTFFLRQSLEIKYLATVSSIDKSIYNQGSKKTRGVGTFLVAGAWLFWKSCFPKFREMVLNSEIGAMGFYRSIGFRERRLFEYVLDRPAGYLLRAIIVMVNDFKNPTAELIAGVGDIIEAHIKRLGKGSRRQSDQVQRKMIFAFLKSTLESRAKPVMADRLISLLIKYRDRLPEASDLLDLAASSGWGISCPAPAPKIQPLLVGYSDRFTRHLENIFHLENARRVQSLQSVMQHPTLVGRWRQVQPRMAVIDELAWVHSPAHIERIAQTSGKKLCTLDLDTQTSEQSYEVALLAVGAVFSLLDSIWNGDGKRGFACIRPPGHHAEPDRAMGFCLFNNVALGARYLQNRYNVERVMIVDIDAHHGNGTQNAFYDCSDVLYLSFHRFPGFPGTGNYGEVGSGHGEGFTVNIPLRTGCSDRDFVEIIHFLVKPLAAHFKPGIILVSCGFDLYMYDRLGGMRATPEAYGLMGAMLVDIAEQVCDGRILFVLEGGYSIKGIQECGMCLLRELCSLSSPNRKKLNQIIIDNYPKLGELKKAIQIHQQYWPGLIS